MRAQVVAEQKVTPLPVAAHLADVDLPQSRQLRRGTQVAMARLGPAQLEPLALDRRQVRLLVVDIGHGNLNVDNRLGGQPGHRRRTDVVDTHRSVTQGPGQAGADLSETLNPDRVVVDDHDRLVAGTTHLPATGGDGLGERWHCWTILSASVTLGREGPCTDD